MRIGIVGSRRYPNMQLVRDYVESLPKDTIVVTGAWPSRPGGYHVVEATVGVDREAYIAAERAGLVTVLVAGSKSKHGRMAGYKRNPITVELSEALAVFWDLQSNGTKSTIQIAHHLQRPIRVFGPDGAEVDPNPYLR